MNIRKYLFPAVLVTEIMFTANTAHAAYLGEPTIFCGQHGRETESECARDLQFDREYEESERNYQHLHPPHTDCVAVSMFIFCD